MQWAQIGLVGVQGLGFRVTCDHSKGHVSHNLNSLKGGYIGDHIGDSRSLDYSSCLKAAVYLRLLWSRFFACYGV